ncbi:hypothetical protein N7520_008208 [Penicillium odoratum]|uniref:uncharacterized protein n=1 Tax=Penicillium odoratum TaxID=1167516 RepID=UPI0025486CEA|nr:uncharacterized protein N7520_008208 [Penicillium odoratum]KAJ5761052.1 hypothetical protein N7520_008208 [Penicillium odoratum]
MDMNVPTPLPPTATDPRLASRPPRPAINISLSRSSSHPTQASASTPPLSTSSNVSRSKSSADIHLATAGASGGPDPQNVPVAEGDAANLLTLLSKFNISHFNLLNQQNEKKRLDDITAQAKRDSDRAKMMRQMYPATTDMFHHMDEKRENNRARLNQSLIQHQDICQQVTAEFAKYQHLLSTPIQSKLTEPIPPAQPSRVEIERINELEVEVNKLKQATSVAQPSVNFPAQIQNSVVEYSTRISRILKSSGEQKKDIDGLRKEIGEIKDWRKGLDNGDTKLPLKSMPEAWESLPDNLKELEMKANEAHRKATQAAGEVTTVKENLDKSATPPNGSTLLSTNSVQESALQVRLELVEQRFSMIESIESATRSNEADIGLLKSKMDSTKFASLESAIKSNETEINVLKYKLTNTETMAINLSKRFGNFQNEKADILRQIDISRQEAATYQKANGGPDKWADRIAALETAYSRLDARMKELVVDAAAEAHAVVLEPWVKRLESFQVALRSIEMRYDNFNTEGLVKQMSHALFEMYGSHLRALEDRTKKLESSSMPDEMLAKLENVIQSELPNVESRVDKLECSSMPDNMLAKSDDSIKSQIRPVEERINKLDADVTSLSERILVKVEAFVKDQLAPLQQVQGSHSESISKQLRDVNELQESSNSLSTAFQELADDHSDDVMKLTDQSNQLSAELKTLAETLDPRFASLTEQIQILKVSLEELQTWATEWKELDPLKDIPKIRRTFGLPEEIVSLRSQLRDEQGDFAKDINDAMKTFAAEVVRIRDELSIIQTKLQEWLSHESNGSSHPVDKATGPSIHKSLTKRDLQIRGCSNVSPLRSSTDPSNAEIPKSGKRRREDVECENSSLVITGIDNGTLVCPLTSPSNPPDPAKMENKFVSLHTDTPDAECGTSSSSIIASENGTPVPQSSSRASPSGPVKKKSKTGKHTSLVPTPNTEREASSSSSVVTDKGTPVPSSSGPSGQLKKKKKKSKKKEAGKDNLDELHTFVQDGEFWQGHEDLEGFHDTWASSRKLVDSKKKKEHLISKVRERATHQWGLLNTAALFNRVRTATMSEKVSKILATGLDYPAVQTAINNEMVCRLSTKSKGVSNRKRVSQSDLVKAAFNMNLTPLQADDMERLHLGVDEDGYVCDLSEGSPLLRNPPPPPAPLAGTSKEKEKEKDQG